MSSVKVINPKWNQYLLPRVPQALAESEVYSGFLQTSIMKIFYENGLYNGLYKGPTFASGSASLVNNYRAVEEKMYSGYNMVPTLT